MKKKRRKYTNITIKYVVSIDQFEKVALKVERDTSAK